jgi:hypothetical protein
MQARRVKRSTDGGHSMQTPKSPVHIRFVQDGKRVLFTSQCMLVLRGRFVGTACGIACFDEVRLVDFCDRRRAHDWKPKDFRGPVTIEILTPDGVVIDRMGLATAGDVAAHPRGEVLV